MTTTGSGLHAISGRPVPYPIQEAATVKEIRAAAAALRRWLASGASQTPDGAYHSWLDLSDDRLAFAYPEITGYVLSHFAAQREMTDVEREAGERAADWLVGRIDRHHYAAHDGWDGEAEYTFDLAMISSGLISFGRRVSNDGYVERGLDLVRLLARQIIGAGRLRALTPETQFISHHAGWATEGDAHLIKVVQCLRKAAMLGLPGTEDAAALVVDRAIAHQRPDGAFVTQRDERFTMLHPHHYAIEGLWMWGVAARDADALKRARQAVDWAWQHQLESGGFPRLVDRSADGQDAIHAIEQSDATAQAVRTALLLDIRHPGLERAISRLIEVSVPDHGGQALVYQPTSGFLHLNSWATLFASQALALAGKPETRLDWSLLV